LGRTASHSLKIALETLLGGTCYHMMELFARPEHVPLWHAAIRGREPDWDSMLQGFTAAVDWPAAAVWDQLFRAYPDSVVLLSTRSSSDSWWASFSETILEVMQRGPGPGMEEWFEMSADMLARLTPDYAEREACITAYEAHNDAVRRSVPADRLIDWTPADGWGPICAGLNLPEPETPFPHVNTRDEFRAFAGLTPS
jgi:Sulfotransferase domain